MACVDFPSAEHETPEEFTVRNGPEKLVVPRPPFDLRYEREELPFEGDLTPDAAGHIRVALPVFVRVEVFPPSDDTECFLVATLNKLPYGRGGDGLTAYASVHRTDFTFRARIFDRFLDDEQITRHNRETLKAREWNELAMALSETKATYWINRVPVATCEFREGDLPSNSLYLGLTKYEADYRFRRLDLSRDPRVLGVFLDRVVTLVCEVVGDGGLRVSCLSMSGEEVAVLDPAGAVSLLEGTRVVAKRELKTHYCQQRGPRTIYDNQREIKVLKGSEGSVSSVFDSGALTLEVTDQSVVAPPSRASGLLEWFTRAAGVPWSRTVYVPAGEVGALQPQGAERLGEFRLRLAQVLNVFPHSLQLTLPDGTLLSRSQDPQMLQALLQPCS